jgi:hypothetical protein
MRLPPKPVAMPGGQSTAALKKGGGYLRALERGAILSPRGLTCDFSVGARGFEPLASSASRKRSTPELSARSPAWYSRAEAGTGIEPV